MLQLLEKRAEARPLRKLDRNIVPTGVARTFADTDIIVSKTDLTGKITYANRVFLDIASMSEDQALGAPHSVIRHPDMPRSVFKLLWERIGSGHEIFAYVVNLAVNGDHYWVFAHVTPSTDATGKIVGYHSNRRVPRSDALARIVPIYADLRRIEQQQPGAAGLTASTNRLNAILNEMGTTYDRLMFSL